MAKNLKKTNDDITTLRMNRLKGQMLRVKSRLSRREILLVYDLHMDLEMVKPLAKKLSRYGNVTAVDLPGFGGMNSFYKIGQKPTIDTYAAYLASFLKLRYKNRRVSLVGVGVGGTFAVRLLQNYPSMANKINNLLLVGSMVHQQDRRLSSIKRLLVRLVYKILLLRPITGLGKTFVLRGPFLRVALGLVNLQAPPISDAEMKEQSRLWRGDDLRSHLYIQKEMLALNIPAPRVSVPTYAVAINTHKDFDYPTWQQHLKVIFTSVTISRSRRKQFVPISKLFDELPLDARKILRQ